MSNSKIQYLEVLRLKELEIVSDLLAGDESPPLKKRVIDIGGGSGFQAKEINKMGLEVLSFDPAPRYPLHYPVIKAFGHQLPIADGWADIVFASQALEHIPQPFLRLTLKELRRALKPSGTAIFTLPSSASMLLTIVLQPLANLLRFVLFPLRRLKDVPAAENPVDNQLQVTHESFPVKLLKALTVRWVLPAPHGVARTAIHELWQWKRSRWVSIFENSGFDVIEIRSSNIAYSMHMLTELKLLSLKEFFGRLGLGGTNAFYLKKCG